MGKNKQKYFLTEDIFPFLPKSIFSKDCFWEFTTISLL